MRSTTAWPAMLQWPGSPCICARAMPTFMAKPWIAACATWLSITPLARNEWICWVESAKKTETRLKRIDWGRENLSDGKRRPCCWPGCPHREKGTGAA